MPTLASLDGRSLVPDLGAGLARGLTAGLNLQQNQLRQQQAEQQRAQLTAQNALAGAILGRGVGGVAPSELSREQSLAQLSVQFPERFEAINKNLGLITTQQKTEAADFAFKLRNVPFEQRQQLINERAVDLRAQGRNPKDTEELSGMDEIKQNEALDVVQLGALSPQERSKVAKGQSSLKAFAPQQFVTETGEVGFGIPTVSPTGETTFRQIRAPEGARFVSKRETPTEAGQKATQREAGKLQAQFKLKPAVAAEVVKATKTAESLVDQQGEQRSNATALKVYDIAMSSLTEALGGTVTGPIAGWLPAVTENQQIADGAIAALAPVLKQLFRSSGEGTFTDSDQRILNEMLPTRKDGPKARISKMQNIDAIVRAKLGSPTIQAVPETQRQTGGQVLPSDPETVGQSTTQVLRFNRDGQRTE